MAAPAAAERTTDSLLNPANKTNHGSETSSVAPKEPPDFVVDFVVKEVGSDLKSLKNVGELLEKLREENMALEEQVLSVSSSVPPKVSAALCAAEEARCSLEELLQRERLHISTIKHLQGAQPWMDRLGQTFNQVDIIERHLKYLRCLQHIEELRYCRQDDDLISQRASASSQGAPSTQMVSTATPLSQEPPLCLPIQIMLLPLGKRFRYHFYGNRQTNSLSKPEWYLTQVLMWMSNSSAFMEEKIQPILDRAGVAISARVELCRGLLCLVQEKVASDASRLLYDDVLFCHLVEEVLQFEKELRSNQSYPAVLPGLLHLLLDDAILQKWLTVEKKMAVEKMDAMLSAEGAWSSQYKDISDMDELKAPDCAETFMTLLQVITERYRALPCPSAQLKFLGLQRELVDDFRIRLTQVMKEESRCPLGPRYCAILNAVNYISTILGDWGDNVFFLQLQQAAVSLGEEVLQGLGVIELGRLASLEGSLFEGLLGLLDRLKGDMMGRLLEWTMREITENAKPYCQDRWLSLPSQHDQSTMTLSSSACPMMLCVRDRLLHLHQVLSLSLFQLAWQGLAERLDNFLYQDVILSNHFSDGGAAQLQFDMTRNLFPLFGHYCKRPENFFKHVKEAYIILCLNIGSALLLRNLLKESAEEVRDWAITGDPSPESALNELGVYCLAPCDVLILLNLKASLPGQ
uniref:RAD50-interacting protein 1 n=1 Tax=Anabas testudineus TaxID=64144 RepID=A0A7N6AVV5_ANATE